MPRPFLSRPDIRLSAFYAAGFLLTGIQLPFWPVWLGGRGLDAREIGLVLAAAIWGKVLTTPILGALADRLGTRRAVMVGLATASFSAYAALAEAGGFWPLLALNFVAAAAQSALSPLGDAVTLAAARAGGFEYGRVRAWGSASFILAALGSGALLAATSAAQVLPLVLAASALVLAACFAIPSLPLAAGAGRRGNIRRLIADRRFWLFVAAAAALQASHQLYYGFGSLYWRSLGYSDATIGLLWAEGVVAEIALFWRGGRLLARLGPLGLMALGGAGGIVRWSLMGLVPWLPGIAALQLLHALTFGASYLGAVHFLSRHVPAAAAASAQAIFAAVSSGVGGGLVMLAAGALYGQFGGRAYLFMALFSGAGLLATLRLGAAGRPGPGRGPA
jgi:MFS transporter, PPP family, 3-phenylpropionic acid transporter